MVLVIFLLSKHIRNKTQEEKKITLIKFHNVLHYIEILYTDERDLFHLNIYYNFLHILRGIGITLECTYSFVVVDVCLKGRRVAKASFELLF